MRKITEFTASQYQLEQNQIQPPEALIQSVQLRIQECELANATTGPNKRTAGLIAALCLIAAAFYFLGTNHTAPNTIPVSNQPTESTPLEEEEMEQPPIEDENDEGEDEQTSEQRTTELQEVEDDIEPPPPQGNEEQDDRDRRFRIRIRPLLEE